MRGVPFMLAVIAAQICIMGSNSGGLVHNMVGTKSANRTVHAAGAVAVQRLLLLVGIGGVAAGEQTHLAVPTGAQEASHQPRAAE